MTDDQELAWLTAVGQELGVEFDADEGDTPQSLARLAQLIGEHVDGALVPQTLFLVGLAAGRASEPAVAAHDFAEKLGALAVGWNAEGERGVSANDQDARA